MMAQDKSLGASGDAGFDGVEVGIVSGGDNFQRGGFCIDWGAEAQNKSEPRLWILSGDGRIGQADDGESLLDGEWIEAEVFFAGERNDFGGIEIGLGASEDVGRIGHERGDGIGWDVGEIETLLR